MRWIALILVGVGCGGAASWLGAGAATLAIGAVPLLGCAVFVGATIWATYLPVLNRAGRPLGPRDADDQAALLSPRLFRPVGLGFFAAGLVGGSVIPVGPYVAITAAAGVVGLALTMRTARNA